MPARGGPYRETGNAGSHGDPAEDYQLARALDLLQGIALYQKTAANNAK